MFLNLSEEFKSPRNYQNPQRGIVVANDDPRRLGRVKCVIAGLIEGRLSELPWISPWSGGESSSSAKGDVPEIGAVLTIEFKYNDIYTGFYTGAWKSSDTASGIYNEDYPNVLGTRDEYGNKTLVNKKKGITDFVHSSGSSVRFDSAGNLVLKVAGKIELQSSSGKAKASFDMNTGKIALISEENSFEGAKTVVRSKEHEVSVGTLTEVITGAKKVKVTGGSSESVGGSSSKSIAGNSNEVILGNSDKLVAQKTTETYGTGKETKVVLGNIVEQLLAGNKELTILLGDVKYTLTAGNYAVNVVAGNLTLETLLGSFKCGNSMGNMSIDPSGGITLTALSMMSVKSTGPISFESSAMIDIKAPIVSINKAAGGMAVTTLTSPVVDTISGAPTMGVPTVLIG